MDGNWYYIDNHRIFTTEEEKLLFQQYKRCPSEGLKKYIIEHNLKFAIKCANQYTKKFPHVQASDLTGYAILGLYEAFGRYDVSRGIKFTSYAVWWIKASITRCVECNESAVRIPANIHKDMQAELKETTRGDSVMNLLNTMLGGVSLDDSMFADKDMNMHDVLFDENAHKQFELVNSKFDMNLLETIMDTCLTKIERNVLTSFFGHGLPDPMTLQDIANRYGRSKEYIRHVKDIAIDKLKKAIHQWEQ